MNYYLKADTEPRFEQTKRERKKEKFKSEVK